MSIVDQEPHRLIREMFQEVGGPFRVGVWAMTYLVQGVTQQTTPVYMVGVYADFACDHDEGELHLLVELLCTRMRKVVNLLSRNIRLVTTAGVPYPTGVIDFAGDPKCPLFSSPEPRSGSAHPRLITYYLGTVTYVS